MMNLPPAGIQRDPNNASRESRQRLRLHVINHYGGHCECCGVKELVFLTIDHIAGDGAEHKRAIGLKQKRDQARNSVKSGSRFYEWLVREGMPSGFRVLCFNCNRAKYDNNGWCPHDLARLRDAYLDADDLST